VKAIEKFADLEKDSLMQEILCLDMLSWNSSTPKTKESVFTLAWEKRRFPPEEWQMIAKSENQKIVGEYINMKEQIVFNLEWCIIFVKNSQVWAR
jgi:hypothetical protein